MNQNLLFDSSKIKIYRLHYKFLFKIYNSCIIIGFKIFLSDEWTWLKVTFSESTRRMQESTWQMQMIRSGDNGKTKSLSQIDRFFCSMQSCGLDGFIIIPSDLAINGQSDDNN